MGERCMGCSDSWGGLGTPLKVEIEKHGRCAVVMSFLHRLFRMPSWVTPCYLVLLVVPIAFLCMPDGIPFVFAGCGGWSNSAAGVNVQTSPCSYSNVAVVSVSSYSTDTSAGFCELSATATYIVYNCTACQCEFTAKCLNPNSQCAGGNLSTGNGTFTRTKSVQCNAATNTHEINFLALQSTCCSCTTGLSDNRVFFRATASAEYCNG
jgi:hypothetical protein